MYVLRKRVFNGSETLLARVSSVCLSISIVTKKYIFFFLTTHARPRKVRALTNIYDCLQGRVARFFLVQTYQNGKNNGTQTIPNGHKVYQMAVKYSKWL
jgi:hypothetical protein